MTGEARTPLLCALCASAVIGVWPTPSAYAVWPRIVAHALTGEARTPLCYALSASLR